MLILTFIIHQQINRKLKYMPVRDDSAMEQFFYYRLYLL
jgi:hypothetical protein